MKTSHSVLDKKHIAIAGITAHIKNLEKAKQLLESEIAIGKKSVLDTVTSLPKRGSGIWVIRDNTYYQFTHYAQGNGLVYLLRHGKEVIVTDMNFIAKYRVATPDEVKQHEEFLANRNKQVIATSAMDPSKCEFYMVTCRGLNGAKVRHKSYEEAEAIAIKLAKKEQHKVWIVGVVSVIEPEVQTSVTTTIKKTW